jgi:hypothetical protein
MIRGIVDILHGRIAGVPFERQSVFFIQPTTQIDHLATLAAEGRRIGFVQQETSTACWTGHAGVWIQISHDAASIFTLHLKKNGGWQTWRPAETYWQKHAFSPALISQPDAFTNPKRKRGTFERQRFISLAGWLAIQSHL